MSNYRLRGFYKFSPEAKQFARERAEGRCEFPGDVCERPNNGVVQHLTGLGIAARLRIPVEIITDPNLNAIMQCDLHKAYLDAQEKIIFQSDNVQSLPVDKTLGQL